MGAFHNLVPFQVPSPKWIRIQVFIISFVQEVFAMLILKKYSCTNISDTQIKLLTQNVLYAMKIMHV